MDLGIEGKVAMITGGSRGLGRQAAYSLAREGCKVSICARSQDQLDATVSEMAAAGYQVHGTQGDVTVEADAVRFHQDTVEQPGAGRHPGQQRGRAPRFGDFRGDQPGAVPRGPGGKPCQRVPG